jgi:uncharacterized membrane protein YhaH (DUF805 family)
MEPINWFMKVVTQHYFDFNGRARRAEYWWFVLVFVIIDIVLSVIDSIVHLGNILSLIFYLAMLLPLLGAAVRRIHDTGRSGWFVLVPIMNIVWAASPGTVGPNEYGPDPKAAA